MASIGDLSTDDDSDDGYVSTNNLKDVYDGIQVHPELNERDAKLKIRDRIKQTKN